MRILAVTNMYPTPQNPTMGIFVQQQVKGLRQIGLNVDVLVIDRTSEGRRAYWGLSRQIRTQVASLKPDVVHVMYGGVIADVTTSNVAQTPVVISFCGSDLLGSTLSGSLRNLSARYGVAASYRAAQKASGIVVKSKNLQDALQDKVDRSKVRIIPNGIDLGRFRPLDRRSCRAQLGWRADGFHVLFASNAKHPGKRPALAQAAVTGLNYLGIPAELHQMSGVLHEEVPVWLNASNVVLLTSQTEGSPNIVKEALACDLPVVSVDVGDVSEQIQGIDGCYLASPEPADLAGKLRKVNFEGPCRVAGRIRMQELSLVSVALRVRDFYGELLEACGNRRTEWAR